jgi:hypothetical protein
MPPGQCNNCSRKGEVMAGGQLTYEMLLDAFAACNTAYKPRPFVILLSPVEANALFLLRNFPTLAAYWPASTIMEVLL